MLLIESNFGERENWCVLAAMQTKGNLTASSWMQPERQDKWLLTLPGPCEATPGVLCPVGFPSTRATLINWAESGGGPLKLWRHMTCKDKLRELALLSQKKRKWRVRADPNSLPLPKGTQSRQGQTFLRGMRWMLRKQWSQVTAREIPAEHKGTTCSGAWQTLQLSPRKTGEPPPLQNQNLTRLPDQPELWQCLLWKTALDRWLPELFSDSANTKEIKRKELA